MKALGFGLLAGVALISSAAAEMRPAKDAAAASASWACTLITGEEAAKASGYSFVEYRFDPELEIQGDDFSTSNCYYVFKDAAGQELILSASTRTYADKQETERVFNELRRHAYGGGGLEVLPTDVPGVGQGAFYQKDAGTPEALCVLNKGTFMWLVEGVEAPIPRNTAIEFAKLMVARF